MERIYLLWGCIICDWGGHRNLGAVVPVDILRGKKLIAAARLRTFKIV